MEVTDGIRTFNVTAASKVAEKILGAVPIIHIQQGECHFVYFLIFHI